MLTKIEQDKILELLKIEISPAIGCTEPIAVALAVAKAKELLGNIPDKIALSKSLLFFEIFSFIRTKKPIIRGPRLRTIYTTVNNTIKASNRGLILEDAKSIYFAFAQ